MKRLHIKNNHNHTFRRVLAVLLAAAMTFALAGCSPRELHIGQVEVNTGVNTAWITPARGVDKFDIPASDFSAGADGSVTYTGTAYRVLQGIDVSTFQQDIDWQRVAASGVQFAILRAGYRGYTEGSIQEDAYFEQNLAGAIDAGLDVGVYFFSQAMDEQEAREEARFVLDKISGYQLAYPVFFDWEKIGADARSDAMDLTSLTTVTDTFCSEIEAAGYQAGLYFNQQLGYEELHLPSLQGYTFWLAEYNDTPSFTYDFDLWQYASDGSVDGIDGDVDLNLAFIGK